MDLCRSCFQKRYGTTHRITRMSSGSIKCDSCGANAPVVLSSVLSGEGEQQRLRNLSREIERFKQNRDIADYDRRVSDVDKHW